MSSNKTSVILNFESEKAPKIEHFDHKLEDDIDRLEKALYTMFFGPNYKIYIKEHGLKKIPKKWEDITKETLNDNDKLSNFVEENFMLNLTDDDRINKDDIENLIRNNGITLNQFRDEMRNRGIEYDKTRRKNNKKGVWLKISLRDNNTKD